LRKTTQLEIDNSALLLSSLLDWKDLRCRCKT